MNDAAWWARVVQARTERDDLRPKRVWVLRKEGARPQSTSRRDVTGMSFGFRALDDSWHLHDGVPVREVHDIQVLSA
jgi:Caudovirus prohead serine protease